MIDISAAARDEIPAALELLFARLPPAERAVSIVDLTTAFERGRIAQYAVLTARAPARAPARDGARREGTLAGVVLYVLQEDRTAFVWPPSVVPHASAETTADALLAEVIRQIEKAQAWIGQCLIDADWQAERMRLERNGFRHLTDLRFLVCRLDDSGQEPVGRGRSPESDVPVETIPYQPGVNDGRFARLIEQTYLATRDCPEVGGLRSGEHALVSHRMSGEFDPSRWLLFRWRQRDAGVLLLNDHPQQDAWELVYLGVAPDCRGQGIGRAMLAHGLERARAAKRGAILLAVDCRNEYAGKVYDELGFIETDRKAVHVYFPQPAPGDRTTR